MQRARLTRIKLMANKLPTNPFDEFKNSLPKELDSYKGNNYRLEAAWKAYGKPKNLNEAVWEGLILPVGENEYKMPSIGYNEETEDYEYLNTGKENDTIAKDIRAWDNDVIPFIKELKQGGYVRTFNEEKDCWTYSKNTQKESTLDLEQSNVSLESSGELIDSFLQGGQMNVIPEGALHARKNNMEGAGEDFTAKGIPVVDNDGNQLAEIERNEVIFNHSTTTKLEELYKKFNNTDKESEKNEIAIKAGKILTNELINNTQDNTGLILEVAEKNNLEYTKYN